MYKFYHKFQHLSSPGRIKSMATAFPFSHWRGSASAGFRCFYPWLYAYVPGKPGRCRASLISKHGTNISSCHCIFAPTAPVTAVLRNFPLSPNCCRRNPLCSSLSYLHIWGRPHHFGRIPPAVNMPRPNKSSFSPVFRKWHTSPRCSWWKGMQGGHTSQSFIFSSQASSPHHMVLMKPPCFSWSSLASSRL